MKVISFKVDDELYDMIETIALAMNIPKSEVIRRALRYYIKYAIMEKQQPFVTRRMKIY